MSAGMNPPVVLERHFCANTADLQGTNKYLDMLEQELSQYFKGKLKGFRVSIDVSGTPFEKVVWQQLLAIPYGETRTYGQIARQVGKPEAVRAGGRANGANYLSIVIPCHRVIRTDGEQGKMVSDEWIEQDLLLGYQLNSLTEIPLLIHESADQPDFSVLDKA